jgi:uncharacterized integral membrane protein
VGHDGKERDRKQLVAGGTALVLTIAFGVANSQHVRVHWLITTTTSRLIVVIAVSALIGAVLGYAVARRRKQ